MSDLIGRTLGHYRIVEKIGEGGMGEVYRAHDEKLDRDVAIKVLPEAVTQDAGRLSRFETEAKAVAALNHPNIVTIFSVEEAEGAHFITMELVEGKTLSELIPRKGMPVAKLLGIAIPLANAVSTAHEQGIIHRDLKPDNLMVNDEGMVKILDFGLAKLRGDIEASGINELPTQSATQQGRIVGTAAYMSPEQAEGKTIDQRSDIFSLGIVLFEMATGIRPFTGDSTTSTLSAILKDTPPLVTELNPSLPPLLARIVRRCLVKDPEHRYQHVKDLRNELEELKQDVDSGEVSDGQFAPKSQGMWKWIAVATGAIAIGLWVLLGGKPAPAPEEITDFVPNRVVVAEFENRIGDPSFDDFGIQVADSITALLRQVDRLTVATNPYRSEPQDAGRRGTPAAFDRLRRLAEATRSGLVVTGACYSSGDEVEIQARIVDPWQDEVKQSFEAVTAARSDPSPFIENLSQKVAGTLALHFYNTIPLGLSRPVPLVAVAEFGGAGEGLPPFDTAIFRLERALEIDPGFHLARWALLRYYAALAMYREAEAELEVLEGYLPDMTQFNRTFVRAARAQLDGRPLEALSALREAVDLAPNTFWIRNQAGMWAIHNNRPVEAVEVLGGIPFDWTSGHPGFVQRPFVNLCFAHHMLGNDEAVLRLAVESLEHFPDAMIFYGLQANVLGVMGRFEEMNGILEASLSIRHHSRTSAGVSFPYTARELRAHGYHEQSLDVAERAVEWFRERPDEIQRESWFYVAALNAAERWQEARDFAERAVHEEPSAVRFVGLLGVLEARIGRTDEARQIAAELQLPGDDRLRSERTYWRACIAAQLGRLDEAVSLLQRAFSEGHRFSDEFHRDINLEPLWDYPPFQELIEPKG
jgi:tetratricopeptide (TPR) repeat protein